MIANAAGLGDSAKGSSIFADRKQIAIRGQHCKAGLLAADGHLLKISGRFFSIDCFHRYSSIPFDGDANHTGAIDRDANRLGTAERRPMKLTLKRQIKMP